MKHLLITILLVGIVGCSDNNREKIIAFSCRGFIWQSESRDNCAYREYVVYERKGTMIKVKSGHEFIWLDESNPDFDIKRLEN